MTRVTEPAVKSRSSRRNRQGFEHRGCYITHSEAQKKAAEFIKNLIKKHDVDLISIGNGTASKETEIFTAELFKDHTRYKS